MKSKSVANGTDGTDDRILRITLAMSTLDHQALANYLDSGVEMPAEVSRLLTRIVCQGAIYGANTKSAAVNNVFCRDRAEFNRTSRNRRIPQARRTGGPGQ